MIQDRTHFSDAAKFQLMKTSLDYHILEQSQANFKIDFQRITKTRELTQILLIKVLEFKNSSILSLKQRKASAVDDISINFKLLIKLTIYRNQ